MESNISQKLITFKYSAKYVIFENVIKEIGGSQFEQCSYLHCIGVFYVNAIAIIQYI